MSIFSKLFGEKGSSAASPMETEIFVNRLEELSTSDPKAALKHLKSGSKIFAVAIPENEALFTRCYCASYSAFAVQEGLSGASVDQLPSVYYPSQSEYEFLGTLAKTAEGHSEEIFFVEGSSTRERARLFSKMDALCRLAGDPKTALVLIGEGFPCAVRRTLIEEAAAGVDPTLEEWVEVLINTVKEKGLLTWQTDG